jgi:hypothetical protein
LKSDTTARDEYKEFFAVVQEAIEWRNGRQPGDTQKAAQRMIDVVKCEGMAAGRPMPKRLPLGSESLKIIKDKCFETLRICNEWEDLITSTDVVELPGRKRKAEPLGEDSEED